MEPLPCRRRDLGEVMFRGNIGDEGLPEEPASHREAFAGGWFHTGDLGVMHPDGYVQLKDRSKDIIISGGENISSIEVEDVLYKHPAVAAAAVVAKPDEKWGETPCAFIELKPGQRVTPEATSSPMPRAPGPLQGAAPCGVRRAAEDLDRQDPEVRAARTGKGDGLGIRGQARGRGRTTRRVDQIACLIEADAQALLTAGFKERPFVCTRLGKNR
jgi:hypothetical protein